MLNSHLLSWQWWNISNVQPAQISDEPLANTSVFSCRLLPQTILLLKAHIASTVSVPPSNQGQCLFSPLHTIQVQRASSRFQTTHHTASLRESLRTVFAPCLSCKRFGASVNSCQCCKMSLPKIDLQSAEAPVICSTNWAMPNQEMNTNYDKKGDAKDLVAHSAEMLGQS